MSKPNYDVRVEIPAKSKAWESLASEIPRGSDLQSAYLVLTPKRASLSLYYRGRKPDGEPHKRTSVHSVTIDPTAVGSSDLLRSIFGRKSAYADTFGRLLPGETGG